MITPLPKPKLPPIMFFSPISPDEYDNMTAPEFYLGVIKKVNETVTVVNTVAEEVDGFDVRISTLETDFDQLKIDVNKEISDFTELFNAKLATNLLEANTYTNVVRDALEEEIQRIIAGQIEVYDPTTGLKSDIQTVINNIYGESRYDALTATEYDGLELTATEYEAYSITAYQYDQQGKTLLV